MKYLILTGLLMAAPVFALGGEATESSPTPEHPVGWRNDGIGHYPGVTPPMHWSQIATNGAYECKKIVWKVRLPSHSVSSPLVVGDKIYVAGNPGDGNSPMDMLCLDSRDGKALWMKTYTYYNTISMAERRNLLTLQVDIDAARGSNIFLVANRKLGASAAAEGNYDVAGVKVVKAELLGTSGQVVKLTLSDPLKNGQALTIGLKGDPDGGRATVECAGERDCPARQTRHPRGD